ncbi:MAG TPA: hypothetical protein VFK02_09465, partial [Kofleriaceae bacterium]|nr:hypothetical protein [Kofleriaceae bacterium]
ALGAVMLLASPVAAAPGSSPLLTSEGLPARRLTVAMPPEMYATPSAAVSRTLYLERCRGGCTVHRGPNDARTATSMIPMMQDARIGEFASVLGLTGAAADAEWAQLVQCMKEVYSPYNVHVTDVKPASGEGFHMAIVAGLPEDIGLGQDILGVAPLASDCRAIDNVISFSFANHHPPEDRVLNICWTAAQESAHAYGLDHEYAFSNNRSACNDPMTYRNDCGGQKFFRNEAASCGETRTRACQCGRTQNSHGKLLSVFGPGTPITQRPSIAMTLPTIGDGALDRMVTADAGAQRGIARVEVYFNGFKWAEAPGVPFERDGQPDATYQIPVPASLPNSIVDVKTIAFDDLEITTESSTVTVTKGAPCQDATACATGQKCETGRCFWDPPVGEIGERCTYPQFCKSLSCDGPANDQVCTQTCVPELSDSCPSGFDCVATSATRGLCQVSSGCCSVDRSGQGWLAPFALGAALLGLVRRGRQHRRARRAPRA